MLSDFYFSGTATFVRKLWGRPFFPDSLMGCRGSRAAPIAMQGAELQNPRALVTDPADGAGVAEGGAGGAEQDEADCLPGTNANGEIVRCSRQAPCHRSPPPRMDDASPRRNTNPPESNDRSHSVVN